MKFRVGLAVLLLAAANVTPRLMLSRALGRGVVAFLVAAMLLPVPTSGITWGPERAIADGSAWTGPNAMSATSPAGVQVAYRTQAGVFLLRSEDGGTTWLDPAQLGPQSRSAPALAASGTHVDVVWVQPGSDGRDRLQYRHSADEGATWSSAVTLARASARLGTPSVARIGDFVAVTWTNTGSGRVFVRITSGGAFRPAVVAGLTARIDPNTNLPEALPDVAVARAQLAFRTYVTFYANASTLKVTRSADDGASWGTPAKVATSAFGYPSIAARGTVALIAYSVASGRDTASAYRRSSDGGRSWGPVQWLSSLEKARSHSPMLSVRGSVFRAVFLRCVEPSRCDVGDRRVLYRESTTGGRTWSQASVVFHGGDETGSDDAFPVGVDHSGGMAVVAYRVCAERELGEVCWLRLRQGS